MGFALALLSALCYGTSDFVAGLASRRDPVGLVAAVTQAASVVAAAAAVAAVHAGVPGPAALAWGAVSGLGSGCGTLALYRGFAVGRLGVVAPVSGVLTAALPAAVGLATGNRVSALAVAGMVLALPAVALVSLHGGEAGRRGGVIEGLAAGAGFALLFIALSRAGTGAGAWPVLAGQLVSLLVVLPAGMVALRAGRRPARLPAAVVAGVLAGGASLLFLGASGRAPLAVVAVLSALYPAVVVVLARLVLEERWTRLQVAGLAAAVAAVVLITAG